MTEFFTDIQNVQKITQLMHAQGTIVRKDLWKYDFGLDTPCEEVYERNGSIYTFYIDVLGSVESIKVEPTPKTKLEAYNPLLYNNLLNKE